MENLIYTDQDGNALIVIPVPIEHLRKMPQFKNMTQEQYEAHVWERSIPEDAIDPQELKAADIPNDRYFRNAWKQNGNKINIDMPLAREIHMNAIRIARDLKLKELDIETMKGREVQTEKQILRDLPVNTDLTTATTPEELKAIWPKELPTK